MKSIKKILVLAAMVAFTLFASTQARAEIIFDNYADYTFISGNNPFSYNSDTYVAQLVTISEESWIDTLTFNAFTTGATVPIEELSLQIYSQLNGEIDALIYSATFTFSNSGTAAGTDGQYTLTDYTYTLDNIHLLAGTYYIALHAEPLQWDMHWSITQYTDQNFISTDGGLTFATYTDDQALRLEGTTTPSTPEPATLALLGLGLFGAGIMGKRSRKTKM